MTVIRTTGLRTRRANGTRRVPLSGASSCGTSGGKWEPIRKRVLARDRHTCQYCGAPATTVDHVRPRWMGGTDDLRNLVACCRPCQNPQDRSKGVGVVPVSLRTRNALQSRVAGLRGLVFLGNGPAKDRVPPVFSPLHGPNGTVSTVTGDYSANKGRNAPKSEAINDGR